VILDSLPSELIGRRKPQRKVLRFVAQLWTGPCIGGATTRGKAASGSASAMVKARSADGEMFIFSSRCASHSGKKSDRAIKQASCSEK
jgi:hypothetical protein